MALRGTLTLSPWSARRGACQAERWLCRGRRSSRPRRGANRAGFSSGPGGGRRCDGRRPWQEARAGSGTRQGHCTPKTRSEWVRYPVRPVFHHALPTELSRVLREPESDRRPWCQELEPKSSAFSITPRARESGRGEIRTPIPVADSSPAGHDFRTPSGDPRWVRRARWRAGVPRDELRATGGDCTRIARVALSHPAIGRPSLRPAAGGRATAHTPTSRRKPEVSIPTRVYHVRTR